MIEPLSDLPDGVLGFRAVGEVEASDYTTTLDPAVDASVDEGRKVNLVYVMGEDFERYSLDALWQDALLGGRPSHVWGRIALVTDHRGIGDIVHAISFLFPWELRIFAVSALDDAIMWAASGPKEE